MDTTNRSGAPRRGRWSVWKALFLAAWGAHLSFLSLAAGSLPALVADPSHAGKTWSRDGFLAIALGMGLVVPVICTWGVVLVARHAQGVLNMPHKDYWMAPERREGTLDTLTRLMWPLGLLMVLGQAGSNLLVFDAAFHWRMDAAWSIAGGVLWTIAMAAWIGVVLHTFRMPERTTAARDRRDRPRAPHRRTGR